MFVLKDLTTEECEETFHCFKSPSTCSTSKDCDMLVLYKHEPDSNIVSVKVATKSTSKYIGWAQSTVSNKMVRKYCHDCTYCIYAPIVECTRLNSNSNTYHCPEYLYFNTRTLNAIVNNKTV